jgi:hypothetical protein
MRREEWLPSPPDGESNPISSRTMTANTPRTFTASAEINGTTGCVAVTWVGEGFVGSGPWGTPGTASLLVDTVRVGEEASWVNDTSLGGTGSGISGIDPGLYEQQGAGLEVGLCGTWGPRGRFGTAYANHPLSTPAQPRPFDALQTGAFGQYWSHVAWVEGEANWAVEQWSWISATGVASLLETRYRALPYRHRVPPEVEIQLFGQGSGSGASFTLSWLQHADLAGNPWWEIDTITVDSPGTGYEYGTVFRVRPINGTRVHTTYMDRGIYGYGPYNLIAGPNDYLDLGWESTGHSPPPLVARVYTDPTVGPPSAFFGNPTTPATLSVTFGESAVIGAGGARGWPVTSIELVDGGEGYPPNTTRPIYLFRNGSTVALDQGTATINAMGRVSSITTTLAPTLYPGVASFGSITLGAKSQKRFIGQTQYRVERTRSEPEVTATAQGIDGVVDLEVTMIPAGAGAKQYWKASVEVPTQEIERGTPITFARSADTLCERNAYGWINVDHAPPASAPVLVMPDGVTEVTLPGFTVTLVGGPTLTVSWGAWVRRYSILPADSQRFADPNAVWGVIDDGGVLTSLEGFGGPALGYGAIIHVWKHTQPFGWPDIPIGTSVSLTVKTQAGVVVVRQAEVTLYSYRVNEFGDQETTGTPNRWTVTIGDPGEFYRPVPSSISLGHGGAFYRQDYEVTEDELPTKLDPPVDVTTYPAGWEDNSCRSVSTVSGEPVSWFEPTLGVVDWVDERVAASQATGQPMPQPAHWWVGPSGPNKRLTIRRASGEQETEFNISS